MRLDRGAGPEELVQESCRCNRLYNVAPRSDLAGRRPAAAGPVRPEGGGRPMPVCRADAKDLQPQLELIGALAPASARDRGYFLSSAVAAAMASGVMRPTRHGGIRIASGSFMRAMATSFWARDI